MKDLLHVPSSRGDPRLTPLRPRFGPLHLAPHARLLPLTARRSSSRASPADYSVLSRLGTDLKEILNPPGPWPRRPGSHWWSLERGAEGQD
jgi:hypothetical protein